MLGSLHVYGQIILPIASLGLNLGSPLCSTRATVAEVEQIGEPDRPICVVLNRQIVPVYSVGFVNLEALLAGLRLAVGVRLPSCFWAGWRRQPTSWHLPTINSRLWRYLAYYFFIFNKADKINANDLRRCHRHRHLRWRWVLMRHELQQTCLLPLS